MYHGIIMENILANCLMADGVFASELELNTQLRFSCAESSPHIKGIEIIPFCQGKLESR